MTQTNDSANRPAPISEDTQRLRPHLIRETDWLTPAQAAEYAGGISVWTVRQACNVNRLRHVRIGGSQRGPIRTRREWVDEWLAQWVRGGQAA